MLHTILEKCFAPLIFSLFAPLTSASNPDPCILVHFPVCSPSMQARLSLNDPDEALLVGQRLVQRIGNSNAVDVQFCPNIFAHGCPLLSLYLSIFLVEVEFFYLLLEALAPTSFFIYIYLAQRMTRVCKYVYMFERDPLIYRDLLLFRCLQSFCKFSKRLKRKRRQTFRKKRSKFVAKI